MTAGEWDEAIEAVASLWHWKDHAFLCPVYNERRDGDARGCNCGIRDMAERCVRAAAPLIARAALEKAADAAFGNSVALAQSIEREAHWFAMGKWLRERAKEAGGG